MNVRTLNQVVRLLKKAAPHSTIILFGSWARGEGRADSDIDLLVIEQKVRSRRREMMRLTDALRPLCVPVDVLVVSQAVFKEWSDIPGTVIYAAAREGKIVHEAA